MYENIYYVLLKVNIREMKIKEEIHYWTNIKKKL